MGRLGIVKQIARAVIRGANVLNAIADPGGGANVTARVFSASGEDAPPLPDDTAVIIPLGQIRGNAAVGFADTKNVGVAAAGEVRRYSRNASGSPVAVLWLKTDGSIEIVNGGGSFVMAPGGNVTINGVEIDTSGNITTPGTVDADTVDADTVDADTVEAGSSLTVNGKEVDGHLHGGVTPGGGQTAPF